MVVKIKEVIIDSKILFNRLVNTITDSIANAKQVEDPDEYYIIRDDVIFLLRKYNTIDDIISGLESYREDIRRLQNESENNNS